MKSAGDRPHVVLPIQGHSSQEGWCPFVTSGNVWDRRFGYLLAGVQVCC